MDTNSATCSPSTQQVVEFLKQSLTYEAEMEHGQAQGQGYSPGPYLPAARTAYQRVLAILGKHPLVTADLDAIHAELLSVFQQPHYRGMQLGFVTRDVDDWLAGMDPSVARLSLYEIYRGP